MQEQGVQYCKLYKTTVVCTSPCVQWCANFVFFSRPTWVQTPTSHGAATILELPSSTRGEEVIYEVVLGSVGQLLNPLFCLDWAPLL